MNSYPGNLPQVSINTNGLSPFTINSLPAIISCLINTIANGANKNQLRAAGYQYFAGNNFNNTGFTDLVQMTARSLNDWATENPYLANDQNQAGNALITLCNDNVIYYMGFIYEGLRQKGTVITDVNYNEMSSAVQYYTALRQRQAAKYENSIPVNTFSTYSNGVPTSATTQPEWLNSVVPNASSGLENGINSSGAPAWRNQAGTQATATPNTTPTAVEENEWTVAPEGAPFIASKIQPYQLAYNPRITKRVLYINKQGVTKEEFTKVDYDQHALQTPLTHAMFNLQKEKMWDELGREPTDEEVGEIVNRVEPTPTRFTTNKLMECEEIGLSLNEMKYYGDFVSAMLRHEVGDYGVSPCQYRRGEVFFDLTKDQLTAIEKLMNSDGYDNANKMLNYLSDKLAPRSWNALDRIFTEEVNILVKHRMGLQQYNLQSFATDWEEIKKIVLNNYGDLYYTALTSKRNYVMNKWDNAANSNSRRDLFDMFVPWGRLVAKEVTDADGTKRKVLSTKGITEDEINAIVRDDILVVIDYNSFDFDCEIKLGQSAAVTLEVSEKMRALADDLLFDYEKLGHIYVETLDGCIYQILRGAIDSNVSVWYHVM